MFFRPYPTPVASTLVAVGLLVLAASSCRDDAADPLAALFADDAQLAFALRPDLPSLPALVALAGIEPETRDEIRLWDGSWEEPTEERWTRRRRAHQAVSLRLAVALGIEGAGDLLSQVGASLDDASTPGGGELSVRVEDDLSRAAELFQQGTASLAAGRVSEAFALGLEAGDRLREVAPATVAATMLARAEQRLQEGTVELSDLEVDRGQRLLTGARRALKGEDWTLAIWRAFYAWQVLGGESR